MNKFQRKIKIKGVSACLVVSEKYLHGICWEDQGLPKAKQGSLEALLLDKVETQLAEYFEGKRKVFKLPLKAEGTEFQKKVWQQLSLIPHGQTRSYKEVAQALGNAKASRAVGTANGKNPISIVVPCHRVIAADGTMGGYAGGLSIKEKLLALEGVVL